MASRTNSRKLSALISTLAVSILAGALSVGVAAPSLAQDNDEVSIAKINNGYFIENNTGEELFLQKVKLPDGTETPGLQGKKVCQRHYKAGYQFMCDHILGDGYSTQPQASIAKNGIGYFEIPAYRCTPFTTFAGYTLDSTELVYATDSGKKVTLFANVRYGWGLEFCIPKFQNDESDVKTEGLQAKIRQPSTGKGSQTWFSINKSE